MTVNFEHKKILLIAPDFFGYDQEIKKKLEILGAKVDFISDRPFSSPFLKAVTRLGRDLILPIANRFFEDKLDDFAPASYDIIFVIQGEGLSPRILQLIRTRFPHALLILYMWDSFRNKPSLVVNIEYFDRCYSFDSSDCAKYGLQFQPLFFNDGFQSQLVVDTPYKISFIGTAHSDRYKIVKGIRQGLPHDCNGYFYLFLQARWYYHHQKLFNQNMIGSSIDEFEFAPLAKTDVQHIFSQSFSILDIEHPDQIGLTMRTFEALGAKKKLVTTNSAVREYDFFDPDNILIIPRTGNFEIPKDFFHNPPNVLNKSTYNKYSLDSWIKTVLSNE